MASKGSGKGKHLPPPPPPKAPQAKVQPAMSLPKALTKAYVSLEGVRLKKTEAPREVSISEKIALMEASRPEENIVSYANARKMALEAGQSGAPSNEEPPVTAKVLILQKNCISPSELDDLLAAEAEGINSSKRAVDFVILPEGAHHEGGAATLEDNILLQNLAKVIAKHRCWAVLGTMGEVLPGPSGSTRLEDGAKVYCTALIVSPDGSLHATYRKRATLSNFQTPGNSICTFDTSFGRVGVMICYDAENHQFVEETIAAKPIMILNPIHISAGLGSSGADSQSKWRIALESMGRYIDHIVAETGVTWVRCDQPYPCGAGTSQVWSRTETQQVPTKGDIAWATHVMLDSSRVFVAPPPPRARTEKLDNCGTRVTLSSLELMHVASTPSKICFFPRQGSSRGALLIECSDGSRMAVDVASVQSVTGLDDQKADIESALSEQEASLAGVDPKLLELAGLGDILADFVVSVDQQNFYLAVNIATRTLKLIEVPSNGDLTCLKTLDVHHTFFAPPTGVALATYDQKYGTIAVVSPVKAKGQKMIVTFYQFAQNRHIVPLHALLK